MRLAGQVKAGFYPAPLWAMQWAADHMTPPEGDWMLLDPCAGQGRALCQMAGLLSCRPQNVYAIELDAGRAVQLKDNLWPESHVLAPASFMGSRASAGSFSLIWLNPPFDDETGGGQRLEYSFLCRATGWLRTGGVLAMICPDHVARQRDLRQHLMTWFDQVSVTEFPEDVRPYDEVLILAAKRGRALAGKTDSYGYTPDLPWTAMELNNIAPNPLRPDHPIYAIPDGPPPKRFEQIEYTDEQLLAAMQRSPLRRLLLPPEELPLPSPPLALGTGHVALLLAAGHLDGVVRPPDQPPHVVRGTAKKEKYLQSASEKEDSKGNISTKEVWAEKITLTVRAVDAEGTIHTFKQE